MSNDKYINEKGRFLYVEPNNINKYGKALPSSMSIPHPYEDYCMSVELTVKVPDINSCGMPNNNGDGYTEITYSSDKGSISFIGGTNGYLTTNYTDVDMLNPDTYSKEMLGIERIDVNFRSWFTPEISIDFIDVRGAALMMPQEYALYNTIQKEQTEKSKGKKVIRNTRLDGGSFFKAMFSFPYPMFKLKLKGYYGREVTFKLSLANFSATFDSNNGNFVIKTNFIGYMYGIFGDIPLSYLVVAPYISPIGTNYFEKNKDNGRFRFLPTYDTNSSDGPNMYTLMEFRAKINNVEQEAKTALDSMEETTQYRDAKKKLKALKEINNLFTFSSKELSGGNAQKDKINYWNCFIDKGYYYYIANSEERKCEVERDTYNNISPVNEKIESFQSTYNTTIPRKIDEILNQVKSDVLTSEIMINVSSDKSLTITRGNENSPSDIFKNYPAICNLVDSSTNFKLLNNCTGIERIYIYKVKTTYDYKKDILDLIDSCNNTIDETKKKLDLAYNEKFSSILGFSPTIENIFDMTFAHLETFMACMYECLKAIDNDRDSRTLQSMGINIEDTNLNRNMSNTAFVPPFPLFTSEVTKDGETTREQKFPTEVNPALESMPEVKLVYALIEATKMYKSADSRSSTLTTVTLSDLYSNKNMCIPTTLYDIANYNSFSNPYSKFANSISSYGKESIGYLCLIFALRLYSYIISVNPSDEELKVFAILEQNNLKCALSSTNIGLSASLKLLKDNGFITYFKNNIDIKFISILVSTAESNSMSKIFLENGNVNDSVFSYVNNLDNSNANSPSFSLLYNWFTNDDGCWLPVGEFGLSSIFNDFTNDNVYNEKYLNIDSSSVSGLTSSGENIYDSCYIITNPFELSSKYNDNPVVVYDGRSYTCRLSTIERLLCNINNNDTFINDNSLIKVNSESSAKNITMNDMVAYNNDIPGEFINSYKIDINKLLYVNGKAQTISYDSFNQRIKFSDKLFNEIYNKQDKYGRAYLFLFSIATNVNYFINNSSSYWLSGVYPVIDLLKEGAHYWREDFMYNNDNIDPIISTKINHPISNQVYTYNTSSNGYNGLYIKYRTENGSITGISDSDYLTYVHQRNLTSSRKNELIKMFIDWADMGIGKIKSFGTIEKYLIIECETSSSAYQKELMKLLFSVYGIVDISCGKYGMINTNDNLIPENKFKISFRQFYECVTKLISDNEVSENNEESNTDTEDEDSYDNDKLRLTVYLTLKNLYDRWLCNIDFSNWLIRDSRSQFSEFKYIDNYYRDISKRLMINATYVSDLITNYTKQGSTNDETYQGKNMYEFLHEIASKNGCLMMAIPMMFGMGGDTDNDIADVFDAKPYSDKCNNENSSFVVIYTYPPSSKVKTSTDDGKGQDDDGIDIADMDGNISDTLPSVFATGSDTDLKIPAFGVTFAKGNQSYFKNIQLNSDNGQPTEYSMRSLINIASKGSEGSRSTLVVGQDLFRVYSSYAYSCTVEMMGDMQITPLMYFQLNNIPMWHGAYMINEVHHSFSAGDVTTSFTGVRINKNAIPYYDGKMIFTDNMLKWTDDEDETESSNMSSTEDTTYNYAKSSIGAIDSIKNMFTSFTKKNNPSGKSQGWCARFTYWLAYALTKGVMINNANLTEHPESSVGGDANSEGYRKSLIDLGYNQTYTGSSIDTDTLQNLLQDNRHFGDVYIYYANDGGGMHTQICSNGDLSSENNNYYSDYCQNNNFCYSDNPNGHGHYWTVYRYSIPESKIHLDGDFDWGRCIGNLKVTRI